MTNAYIYRMRTPTVIRLLSLRLLPMHANPTLTKWLLLGGPGIGKSYATKEALVRLSKLVFFSAKALMGEEAESLEPLYANEEEMKEDPDLQRFIKEEIEKAARQLSKLPDIEKLCSCIAQTAKAFKPAVEIPLLTEHEEKEEAAKSWLAERVDEELTRFASQIGKEVQSLSKDDEYAKKMKSDLEAVHAYLLSDEELRSRIIGKDAKPLKRAIAKALVAAAIKPKNVDFIVIEYDNEIPLSLYEGAVVYVSKNMGATDIAELAGVPSIETEEGSDETELIPTRWAVALRKALLGLLNLDEFTNAAAAEVKSLSYALTLWESAGSYAFRKPVVATGNTRQTSSLVTGLPGPLITGRLAMIEVMPPYVEEWIDYMRRKYGEKGYSRAAEFVVSSLTSHTKDIESSLIGVKEKAESASSGAGQILANLIGQITFPFSDAFYPPPEEIEKYSEIEPGEAGGFPSPRAWESVAVIIREYDTIYADDALFQEAVKAEAMSLGMPLVAEIVAHLALKERRLGKGQLSIQDLINSVNMDKYVNELAKMLSEYSKSLNNSSQIVRKIATFIFDMLFDLTMLTIEAARCVTGRGDRLLCRQVLDKVNEVGSWLSSHTVSAEDVNRYLATLIVNSLARRFLSLSGGGSTADWTRNTACREKMCKGAL